MQFPRAVGYSFSAHAALVAVILVTGLWRGCTREPPGEQMLIMEVLPLADTAPQQKPEDLLPAPPELLPPTPAPPKPVDDVPIPDPIPDPKPKQKPKPVIERSQTRIRRDPQPTAKPLSRQQIRDQLSRGLPVASFGRPSDFPA